jgi:hypothetical protein
MATAVKSKVKVNAKEDKVNLHTAISSLKKSISDYKIERKSDWKSFKTKFNDDLEKVEKSLKKLTTLHLK